jgi:hypothetical protein
VRFDLERSQRHIRDVAGSDGLANDAHEVGLHRCRRWAVLEVIVTVNIARVAVTIHWVISDYNQGFCEDRRKKGKNWLLQP